jgi:4-amino-4-deoxy-L-arabinose transferase-like glycosyltransferase
MPDERRPSRGGSRPLHERPWLLVAVAVLLVGLAAWRATLGMSFQDDGYYAAATVRLAQGAHLFIDEVFLQSLGFLVAIPFAKLWTWLFGMTGVVVALRLFYVAVATAGAVTVYRLLRPSFGAWACLAAAAVPLLAPPFGLFSVTYNTMAGLGLMLACTLAYASARDGKPALAVAAGAAAGFAAISYPPLVIAAVVLLATLAVRSRDRRLVLAMAAGGAAVAAVFAVWLLATTPMAELAAASRYIVISWSDMPKTVHGNRIAVGLWELGRALTGTWGVPLWVWFAPAAAIGVWTALPHSLAPRHARLRHLALTLLPLALAFPVLADWMIHGRGALWTFGGSYVIAFVLFAGPAVLRSSAKPPSPRREFSRMAVPVGLVGFTLVMSSSNASILWATAAVGMAPLAVAVVACWVEEVARGAVREARAGAGAAPAIAIVFAVLVLLFGSVFKDDPPLTLRDTFTTGAYAGLTTSAGHASEVAECERLAARWIGPSATVVAVELPAAYLVTGGVPLTTGTLLNTGSWDTFTVAYFDRIGRWPDVVWMPLYRVDQPASDTAADPLLSQISRRYRLVERSPIAGIGVFVSKTAAPGPP